MRWEELEDALEVLETEREYDGYFCSIKDAVIIVITENIYSLYSPHYHGNQFSVYIYFLFVL